MGSGSVVLIQSCGRGDWRYERWLRAAEVALSAPPAAAERSASVEELRCLEFAVLDQLPGGPGPAPPAEPPAPGPQRGWSQNPAPVGGGGLRGFASVTAAVWLGGTVVLAMAGRGSGFLSGLLDGSGGEICGGPTADGGVCQNPKGSCPYNHRGNKYAQGKARQAAVAKRVTPARPLKFKKVKRADGMIAAGIGYEGVLEGIGVLGAAGLGHTPPQPPEGGGAAVTPEQLAEMIRPHRDSGFTVSPHDLTPLLDTMIKEGVCVALDTTPLRWEENSLGPAFGANGQANQVFREMLTEWVEYWQPALGEGAWIGGWRNGETGALEVNLTFVFRPEHKEEAVNFAILQGQKSVYDLEHGLIDTHGHGGTAWEPRQPEPAATAN